MRKVMRFFAVFLAACSLFAVPAKGADAAFEHEHEYVVVLEDVEPATCWQPGWELYFYYCEECDRVVHQEKVETTEDHEWSDWMVDAADYAAYCRDYVVEERYCCNSGCEEREFREVPNEPRHDCGPGDVIVEPTCQQEGVEEFLCWNCYGIITQPIPKLDHDMTEWTVDTYPSCFTEGIEGRICRNCDYFETRKTPAYGEHLLTGWFSDVSPGCDQAGIEINACTRCDFEEVRTVPALGHDWGQWYRTEEPTCVDEGCDMRACSRCTDIDRRAVPRLEEHELGNWAVEEEPTCTADGYEKRECSLCSYMERRTLPKFGEHTMGQWAVAEEATCTDGGWEKCLCTVCGFEVMRELDQLGHAYGDAWEHDHTGHWRVCGRCGNVSENEAHVPGPEATENAPQSCTVCGYEIAPVLPPAETETTEAETTSAPTEEATEPVIDTTVPREDPSEDPGPVSVVVVVVAVIAGGAGGAGVILIGKKFLWFQH